MKVHSGVNAFLSGFASFISILAAHALEPALVQDRTAIERIHYNHRLGEKPPFEKLLPQSALEKLVEQDRRKEAALTKVYGIEVTPAMLEAEVQRINSTIRSPEMLTEIKTALGNDPVRFANAFAKPFLVERLLREKFDNDDALHAPQRRECEEARNALLSARANGASATQLVARLKEVRSNAVTETTWQLGRRPPETNAPSANEMEIKKQFGSNAQSLSAPGGGMNREHYFEDLPLPLQQVMRAQLRQTGDISAVIEGTTGFILYVVKERTPATLTTAVLFVPKRSYEQWLNEQN